MKVVVAIDSFKGSLTSLEAGQAVERGIARACPGSCVQVCPLADGGEGTAAALVQGMGGRWQETEVCDPLGGRVPARYGINESLGTAVIEMSAAAGLPLVPLEKRNPLLTTTYGVGELIRDAIARGCRRFIVGIGGCATNDGGCGMLQALGYSLLDAHGRAIARGAQGLRDLAVIRSDEVCPELADCTFRVACDVNNPLCGPRGCSAVFGPQKGATPAMVTMMDDWLNRFAELTRTIFPQADATQPGCGAAGGVGFAFLAYTRAVLESGVSIVLEETGLEKLVADADVVVTGEGHLDGQTALGKAPIGVARLAKKHGKIAIAFAGGLGAGATACHAEGLTAFFPCVRGPIGLEQAMETQTAQANLEEAAEQAFRLYAAARQNTLNCTP